jgi:hypothetical protein
VPAAISVHVLGSRKNVTGREPRKIIRSYPSTALKRAFDWFSMNGYIADLYRLLFALSPSTLLRSLFRSAIALPILAFDGLRPNGLFVIVLMGTIY